MNVNIDADVVIPQVESFYTYKTIPIEYSQSDAENMIREFVFNSLYIMQPYRDV